MTTKYLVIENDQIKNAKPWDREGAICTLPRCGATAKIWAFAGSDVARRDCSADFILDGYEDAKWTRAEIEGSPLLSSYIELPVSGEEQRADDADNRRFE